MCLQRRLTAKYSPCDCPTAHGPVPIMDTYVGPATVATYTVAHGRDGQPEWGLAICDLPGDAASVRTYARIEDPDVLGAVEKSEWVGMPVELVPGPDHVNIVKA